MTTEEDVSSETLFDVTNPMKVGDENAYRQRLRLLARGRQIASEFFGQTQRGTLGLIRQHELQQRAAGFGQQPKRH
jgi:hypothetical protein